MSSGAPASSPGAIDQQPARSLSGGNQQKVVIAKWLLAGPAVVILDEPTRGIDIAAKFEIYTMIDRLAAEGCGILFVSSEIEEADGDVRPDPGDEPRATIVGTFARAAFDEETIVRAAFRYGGCGVSRPALAALLLR